MQLMIDILAETPDALRMAAQFLQDHATLREKMLEGAGIPPSAPLAPAGLVPPVPSHAAPPPPVPPVPPIGNVVDFPRPPVPSLATAPAAPPAVDEFDASGVPFDIRIHQRTRNKKKDGTWKVQKGLSPVVLENVMRELTPRIRTAPPVENAPVAAGADAPVSLPPIPPPPTFTGTVVPPAPQGEAPPAIPQAPSAPQAPDSFRALVSKITKARAAGQLTPEEITQCVTGSGAPSLQLLNNMPHLIPSVEASIDAILATR